MYHLSEFEIKLLRVIQQALPLCEGPFEKVAELLEVSEDQTLHTINHLRDVGIIRRLRPQIIYRNLGRIASLVTAHVPDAKFAAVAEAVSKIDGVSHNYCRDHYYNLWFTLQATSLIGIDLILSELMETFEVEFHSMPAVHLFKLDVRFDPAGPNASMVKSVPQEVLLPDVPPPAVLLSDAEKAVLTAVQREFPAAPKPFNVLAETAACAMTGSEMLDIIRRLAERRVIRKIAAVLNYPLLGYRANVLFCGQVPEDRVGQVGRALAQLGMVSHCYQRTTFAGWPFNLYGMCHADTRQRVEEAVRSFCSAHDIGEYQLLETNRELKKHPVTIRIR